MNDDQKSMFSINWMPPLLANHIRCVMMRKRNQIRSPSHQRGKRAMTIERTKSTTTMTMQTTGVASSRSIPMFDRRPSLLVNGT